MPILIREIERFGTVAGLKINREKTKFLVKNMSGKSKEQLTQMSKIQIVKKLKYLGIQITTRSPSLKEDNYGKLIKQIKQDLEIWAKIQVSMMGRISILKMNTLPKILFLFQNLPIRLDNSPPPRIKHYNLKVHMAKKEDRE